ncbi:MAG TPA: hypothetical protein VFY28_02455 [Candidatus Paceibacterota bacterium]|nr:hypothetical protein [Candidatus Paceibacterota bacterium]
MGLLKSRSQREEEDQKREAEEARLKLRRRAQMWSDALKQWVSDSLTESSEKTETVRDFLIFAGSADDPEVIREEMEVALPIIREFGTPEVITGAVLRNIELSTNSFNQKNDGSIRHLSRIIFLARLFPEAIPAELAEFCIEFGKHNEEIRPSHGYLLADALAQLRSPPGLTAKERALLNAKQLRRLDGHGATNIFSRRSP